MYFNIKINIILCIMKTEITGNVIIILNLILSSILKKKILSKILIKIIFWASFYIMTFVKAFKFKFIKLKNYSIVYRRQKKQDLRVRIIWHIWAYYIFIILEQYKNIDFVIFFIVIVVVSHITINYVF